MPIQHSPPARQNRSQARIQAVLTPTPRAPLDSTPAVPQLRAQLDGGPIMEGAAPSRKERRDQAHFQEYYHERQRENKPEASKSNSSHPQNSSSSSHKKKTNLQKGDKPHSSLLKEDFK
ncbi:hypothetical protein O181_116004 [Austropuccinia psidii MF-1]|uniref:Uncharacterized protein n=1 Tax=Austropuccinia psidii MF-1 TaxID=1389203 RepID=A0A9Q3PW45_9BASI|nr:hypothetical protein [Austropuccinia psidii MF-1]